MDHEADPGLCESLPDVCWCGKQATSWYPIKEAWEGRDCRNMKLSSFPHDSSGIEIFHNHGHIFKGH